MRFDYAARIEPASHALRPFVVSRRLLRPTRSASIRLRDPIRRVATEERGVYPGDIDGRRALAILAVVGCHSAPSLVPGGYSGVDVFFVISSFLITRLIAAEHPLGRFRFREFIARRIRRIVPALVVVLLATPLIGYVVLLPGEYSQLGAHVSGGAMFVGNFLL